MLTRSSSAALVAVAALLLAGAANARAAALIRLGPAHVAGWRVTGDALGAERGLVVVLARGDRDVIDLPPAALATVRRRAAYGEVHLYGAHGSRITVSSRRVRAALGADAAVDMRFRARGRPRTLAPPPGCGGRGERVQPGTLTGSLTIATGLFGLPTMTLRSLPARRVLRAARPKCHGGGSERFVDVQADMPQPGLADFELYRTAAEADVSAQLVRNATAAHPLQVEHLLLGFLPPSAIRVSADNAHATFTGGGPFAGTATFTSPNPRIHAASGTLSGPMTANFRGLGPIPALGSTPVTAMLDRGTG